MATDDPLAATALPAPAAQPAHDPLAATALPASAAAGDDPLAATAMPPPAEARDRLAPDVGLDATMASAPTPAAPVHLRARPPVSLGRYTVVERLGAGAMGVVYRAEDRELGRSVALKQLHQPDATLTDRLVREARSMAQINHPNVVAVYDVGETDGVTYIAMELVTGQSLREWTRTEGRTVPQIVAAYLAAGRGLAAAHGAGLVHRDFKPDNVLVGDDGRIRVTDFGLAASRPDPSGASAVRSIADVNLTTSGSVLGTPAYMAPEQFAGGHVDARTDQFNFCVALYEALYGERPFAGATAPELADNVMAGKIRPAPAGAKISAALRAIVVRGLAVRPGARFPTMEHLLAQLGRDRATPWRRTAVVGAALAAALAIGLVADWVVQGRVTAQIDQAFAATALQTDRAVRLLAERFDAMSSQVYTLPVMRDVTGFYDQADFGLGEESDDDAALAEIHAKLVDSTWKYAREVAGKEHPAIIAVSDAKGRLLYTSAAPDAWKTDLVQLPFVKRAFDARQGNAMTLMRYDDPQLVATRVLGPNPPGGLAVLFLRTLSVGETPRSQYLQIVSAKQLLADIRLDPQTRLSLVALDGTPDGDVPAPGDLVKSIELADPLAPNNPPIGRLVMARAQDSVLALFPHARSVFALAMLGALALAGATWRRARRIAEGRV